LRQCHWLEAGEKDFKDSSKKEGSRSGAGEKKGSYLQTYGGRGGNYSLSVALRCSGRERGGFLRGKKLL